MRLTLVLLVFLGFTEVDPHENIVNKLLCDFFEDTHANIFAKMCWKQESVFNLMKSMWRSRKPKYFKVVEHFKNEPYPPTFTYLILDMESCEKPLELLEEAQSFFDFNHKWIIIATNETFADFKMAAENFQMGVDTEITLVVFEDDSAILYQCYKIKKHNTDVIWENYGKWNPEDGLSIFSQKTKSDRRRNFRKTNLKMGIHVQDPESIKHLEDLRYPRVDTASKQDFLTIKCLMEHLNATFTLTTKHSHGYLNQTSGKWNGIVHALNTEEIEVSGTGLFITTERLEVVDYLSMGNPAKIKFLLRKPPLSYITNILVVSFRNTVWFSMFAISVFFALALYLILNWESKRKMINFQDNYTSSDVTLIVFEAICQQGSFTEPRSVPGRTIMLILFLAFMFLFVAYSANVVVLLQATGDIPDLETLLSSRMAAGALNTTYMVWYLTNLKNPLHQELFDKKITAKGFYSPEHGVEQVRKGFFAFHTLLAPAYDFVQETFTDYEICSLQELDGFVDSGFAYFALKKHSHYRELFKCGLSKINEYGLQKHSYKRYERKPKCYSNAASFGSVGILEVYQACLILLYGIVAGLFILTVEKIVAAYSKKRSARNQIEIETIQKN